MIAEKQETTNHNLILENRKKLTVSDVKDVDRFDEHVVILFTQMGMLEIKGDDLHINKFNTETGELVLEGTVDSILYSAQEKRTPGSFVSKLFK